MPLLISTPHLQLETLNPEAYLHSFPGIPGTCRGREVVTMEEAALGSSVVFRLPVKGKEGSPIPRFRG